MEQSNNKLNVSRAEAGHDGEPSAAHPLESARPYRVFFSHGSEDTDIVEDWLMPKVEKSGAKVFLDSGQIPYGDDFRERIFAELSQCEELLVFLTPSSLRRPWVSAEIGATLIRGKRVVAIVYVSDSELQESGVLSLLGTNNLLTMKGVADYVKQLQARVKAHNDG